MNIDWSFPESKQENCFNKVKHDKEEEKGEEEGKRS